MVLSPRSSADSRLLGLPRPVWLLGWVSLATDAAKITCPVLYVEGAESNLRLDEAEIQDRLATLRARRHTIAGSGHHPHLEQPEAFARAVIEFLAAAD